MKLEFLRPLIKYLPEVKLPGRKVAFKEKLFWTSVILVLFFVMGTIYPYGVTKQSLEQKIRGFEQMTMIFASSIGTITSAGIGPIVTASIILQLLIGAEMIDIDLKTKEGKALFQGTQKILTVLVAIFEAWALVNFTQMVSGTGLVVFTIFQISLGSILLMYMDEVVSKWGIGSGISLFIAGGVAQTIITGSLNPLMDAAGNFVGAIPNFLSQMISGNLNFIILMPLIATTIVFVIVTFCEAMRLEIPLSYGGIRGVGGRFPLKFFYVSNIPVILAHALLMNVRLLSNFAGINENMSTADMTTLQYIVFRITEYLQMGQLYGILSPDRWSQMFDVNVLIHLVIFLIVFLAFCVLFGQFWVSTTGMSSENVAKQIEEGGMQIPGFRRDRRVIKSVLDRYIPQITIISSVAVGIVSVFADLLGALGSGTGILLTVGIIYRLYEDLQKEQMADMSPMFRKFLGKE